MLRVGAEIPSTLLTLSGIQVDLSHYFRNRVGVIFGIPGAFVSADGEGSDLARVLRDNAEALRNEVDFIGCLAINDPHVLKAWGQSLGVSDQYILISDCNGRFARRLGVLDESSNLGARIISFVIICYESRIHWFAVGDDISFEAIDHALIQRPELLKVNRHLVHTRCLRLDSPTAAIEEFSLDCRPCGPQEIQIAVEYALLDGRDVLQAASQKSNFPLVLGRVMTGTVVSMGCDVARFKIGDMVVVAYAADSCGICRSCRTGSQQYCKHVTPTNNGRMRDGSWLLGGLTRDYIVNSAFASHLPEPFCNPQCLPLFGPGLAVYSALKRERNSRYRGEKLAIVGSHIWGLIANRIALSMGFDVTLVDPQGLSSSMLESETTLQGSKYMPLSSLSLNAQRGLFDLVVTPVRGAVDINLILDLAKSQGKVIVVSNDLSDHSEAMSDIMPLPLIFSSRSIVGSCCGSPIEVREILECVKLTECLPVVDVIECSQVDAFLKTTERHIQELGSSSVVVTVRKSLE